jgi:hypothetical protein
MEFSFDVNDILPETITKIVGGKCNRQAELCMLTMASFLFSLVSEHVRQFADVVDKMGAASAKVSKDVM